MVSTMDSTKRMFQIRMTGGFKAASRRGADTRTIANRERITTTIDRTSRWLTPAHLAITLGLLKEK
jgi:hypothetical protein